MRISDIDPDELDDDLDDDGRPLRGLGSRRRRLAVFAAAAAVVAGGIAGAVALTGGDDSTSSPSSSPDVTAADVDEPAVAPPMGVDEPAVPAGFPDYGSDYMGPQLELLHQRTTEAGIRVTLQNSGDWQNFAFEERDFAVENAAGGIAVESIGPPAGGWVAPGWCNPVGGFRLTMAYMDAVGVANGSRYGEPRDGLAVALFSSGYAEGTVFRALVLNVAADVVGVTATWDDDATDTAAPTNGWVVLATPGLATSKFELTIATEAGERSIAWEDLPQEGDLEWQKGCTPPPPALPAAGEQPDDAAAAEEAVRATFFALFDADSEFADREHLLDDATGVEAAIGQLQASGFADAAQTSTRTMTELVFVSPEEAWFRYDLMTTFGTFTSRYGIAYLIDGQWRIARAVICQDLALAGAGCEPWVEEIYPPVG